MTLPIDDADAERSFRFVRFLLRRRAIVLTIATLLAIVAGYRTVLTYAALRSELEELLPESAPAVVALSELRARLPGIRYLGVVIDTGGPENVPAANRFVDALAGRIRNYPPELVKAVRIDSSVERAFAEKFAIQYMDPEDVRKLREAVEARRDWDVTRAMDLNLLGDEEDPPPEVPVAELRKKYESRFGYKGTAFGDRFVSKDGRTVVLLVQTASHGTGYESDARLLSKVKADVAALGFPEAFGHAMRVGYAGDVATRVEETQGLGSDLSISGVVVVVLVVGALVWFYGTFLSVPILWIPLAFGTAYAFALVALPPLSITYLNSNTAFLGSIVVGNGINVGIILLARIQEELGQGVSLARAIELGVATTWRATLAAAMAAAMAYGSLVFTDFRGFNQFAWIGALGLILCWVCMYVLVPPLVSIMGSKLGRFLRLDKKRGLAVRIGEWVVQRPRTVLAATGVLAVLAVVGIGMRSSDWIEYDFSKLRRRDSWESGERYWGKRMDDALGRYLTPTVVMAKDADEAREIEKRVRGLAEQGRASGLIASVQSSETWLPSSREESIAEAKELAALLTPKLKAELSEEDRKLVDRALSKDSLRRLEPSDLPDALVAGLREHSGRLDRNVLVYPKLGSSTWNAATLDGYSHDLRQAATLNGELRPVAGSLLLSSDIASAMRADGPRATLVSLGCVMLICWLGFRPRASGATVATPASLRSALIFSAASVGALMLGVLWMLGVMAWTGERLNFSNFIALPIAFGIGADYALNMLKRYQSEKEVDIAALSSTGGAVVLCSVTTVIGFGSLLMAQNRALFSFGVLAIAAELASLVTAVFVLPAALARVRARRENNAPSGSVLVDAG